ncbi:MAG: zinc-binding dehydrogenase [Gammaproteobacteria bacterium]
MRAIEVHHYGSAAEALAFNPNAERPKPGDDEILIEVHATAVNPVDCVARSGYGRHFFASVGWGPLPWVLGRDVSGIVAEVGDGVTAFQPGDPVYAAPPLGCYADFVAVKADHVAPKPRNLSHLEAASLPFVALTTWSALVEQAGLTEQTAVDKKVVIPRAAGGVGSFAIQLMKAFGAYVTGICSARNVELVTSLGADEVIDYTKDQFWTRLDDYDVAFDTVGRLSDFSDVLEPSDLNYQSMNGKEYDELLLNTLKEHGGAIYVTICSPKVALTNKHGLEKGLEIAKTVYKERATAQEAHGRRYLWSFFNSSGQALREIADLVEAGKIRPCIDRIFDLKDLTAAHEYCESKQAQGKIVVEVKRT